MELLILLLMAACLLIGFIGVAAAVIKWLSSSTNPSKANDYRKTLGLTDHQVIKVGKVVTSSRYGLQGYIPFVLNRGNEYIPVLQKTRGTLSAYKWDRAQVIAACMLTEDYFSGATVPYGVLLLGTQGDKILFDDGNRKWIEGQLRQMRSLLKHAQLPARPSVDRCGQCRVKDGCWSTFPNGNEMR